MPKLERFPEKEADYAYGIVFLSRKHRLMKALHKRHQPRIYGHRPWESKFSGHGLPHAILPTTAERRGARLWLRRTFYFLCEAFWGIGDRN